MVSSSSEKHAFDIDELIAKGDLITGEQRLEQFKPEFKEVLGYR